jgi:hypothetical protein
VLRGTPRGKRRVSQQGLFIAFQWRWFTRLFRPAAVSAGSTGIFFVFKQEVRGGADYLSLDIRFFEGLQQIIGQADLGNSCAVFTVHKHIVNGRECRFLINLSSYYIIPPFPMFCLSFHETSKPCPFPGPGRYTHALRCFLRVIKNHRMKTASIYPRQTMQNTPWPKPEVISIVLKFPGQ